MTVVMVCLGEPNGDGNKILTLLDTLFSTDLGANEKKQILQKAFGIAMTQTMEKELNDMCNLSEGFEARGFEKGRDEGRAEGLAEGCVEGRTEGTLDAIRSLIKSTGWSIERSMSALNVPEKERPKYLEVLKS